MSWIDNILELKERLSSASQKMQVNTFKTKHMMRRRFYTLLLDYINAPGVSSPADFFDWYIGRLDERMRLSPQWLKAFYGLTKAKNEPAYRSFMQYGSEKSRSEPDFTKVLKEWLPDDEYRVLSSGTTADISGELRIVIEMCDEKQAIQQQFHNAIFANIITVMMGVAGHWILYSFIYQSFVTPGFQKSKTWDQMSMVEQNYMRYEWVFNNYLLVIAIVFALSMFLKWSIKHWHKKAVFFREHYIDYIPPYSLSKVNEQYNILMLTSSFMRSGRSFAESLEMVREGSGPYIRRQIDKILNNSTEQSHIAINTFYMGDYGSDIRDRANYVPLGQSIESLLPGIKLSKTARFQRIVNVTLLLTFKPLVYGSLALSLVPLVMQILDNIPKQ